MRPKLVITFVIVFALVYGGMVGLKWLDRHWVEVAKTQLSDLGLPWQRVGAASKSFAVPAGRKLVIESSYGDVTILGGGRGVTVEATRYVRAETARDARGKAKPPTLSGEIAGEAFKIATDRPSGGFGVKTDLVVHLPAGMALAIEARTGKVTVSGLTAAVKVAVTAGEVEVKHGRGAVNVHAGAGNVTITDVRGAVTADAGTGEITLDEITGPIAATCRAGNVTLHRTQSDRIVATSSVGNVDVSPGKPFSGTLKAHTGTGNVTVSLPNGSRCRVKTDVGMGQIQNSLPPEVEAGHPPGLVEASSSMGNVDVTAAE